MVAALACRCGFAILAHCFAPRWWTDNKVICCLVMLAFLTFHPCQCLEESLTEGQTVIYNHATVNLTYYNSEADRNETESFQGKYGSKSLVERRVGLAVHVRTKKDNKTHGCHEYGNKIPSEKWIAVVERGVCYFTDKIKMATKDNNASAVVIYDSDEGRITVMQHSVVDQVSIFVARKTGLKIAKLVDSGKRVILSITPGEKDTVDNSNSPNSISKTSVLFVSISFIVLMIISLAWLVFYYIQRFRYAHAKERLARRLASAAKKAIAKIPQKTVKNGDKELDTEFDQCAVCIEGYRPHDVIRTLPCRHVFHKSCVDPWLLDQRSCPMCKLDILRAYGMQVFGSQESVHPDVESAAAPVEEHEHSSTTDDQAVVDTEVKVLLLPHSCLHFHPGENGASSSSAPAVAAAADASSPDGHQSPSSSAVLRHSPSGDRLWQSEMQALMAASQEEEEEEGEGEDSEREQPPRQKEERVGMLQDMDGVQLVVQLPHSQASQEDVPVGKC